MVKGHPTLSQAVQAFWNVSLVWNRGQNKRRARLTVGDALEELLKARSYCLSQRSRFTVKLESRVIKLRRDIISNSASTQQSEAGQRE